MARRVLPKPPPPAAPQDHRLAGASEAWTGSWRWLLVLLAVALAAYRPALSGGFIWDDDAYVEDNETLRTLGVLYRIWFHATATPQYYPLVHTTFWIELAGLTRNSRFGRFLRLHAGLVRQSNVPYLRAPSPASPFVNASFFHLSASARNW